jgi:HAMP domain-containing protein
MTTQAHPIDVPAGRALIAAAILIVGFCVLVLTGQLVSRLGSTQGSATGVAATQPFAEFED